MDNFKKYIGKKITVTIDRKISIRITMDIFLTQ